MGLKETYGFCFTMEVSHRSYSIGASAAQCQGCVGSYKTPVCCLKTISLEILQFQLEYNNDLQLPTFIMLFLLFKVTRIIDKLVLTLISLTVL